jgi:hypothetical protein
MRSFYIDEAGLAVLAFATATATKCADKNLRLARDLLKEHPPVRRSQLRHEAKSSGR